MQTKQRIYETAKILFIEEGYQRTTNRKIAEAAGVNQGLISYYFKHKQNIAITILRENYQILSGHLRNEIDVHKDPFLFNIAVDNMMSRLSYFSKDYFRFLNELFDENLVLESIYQGVQKNDLMLLLAKYEPEYQSDAEKSFRRFVSLTFPTAIEIQRNINRGFAFSFDEYYNLMVHLWTFALNLKWTESEIQKAIEESSAAVDRIIASYPFLKNPGKFLYSKELLTPTPIEKLLDI
ncbi:MAG: TetR/AcrR family transcriptional regulator [Anaerofustis sp.]